MSKGKKLRQLLAEKRILPVPGASTALFAKMVEDAGFDAVYATGAGIANMNFAYPDMGLITMTEVLEVVKRITDAVNLPVIVDIDNGFGNPVNVIRTAKEFCAAGAAALQLEDQVMPKKCGHFTGKAIISTEEMVSKIKAAKDHMDPDVMLITRTDAIAVNGIDDALRRAEAFAAAGADVLFVEAPTSVEDMRRITTVSDLPHLANMVEGGKTPILTNDELADIGFKLVLYANAPLKAAVKGCGTLLAKLKHDGTTRTCDDLMVSMDERKRITQTALYYGYEKKYVKTE